MVCFGNKEGTVKKGRGEACGDDEREYFVYLWNCHTVHLRENVT